MAQISIVVPAYNCSTTIERCLGSILGQTFRDIEVIVVDDASTDSTFQVAQEIASKDERLKVFRQQCNGGGLLARKRGVAETCGDYIMFVDDDDWIDNCTCQSLMDEMHRDPVDILHFGAEVEVAGQTVDDPRRIAEGTQKYLEPLAGSLRGADVFRAFFVEHAYRWNLVNKMFDARLCRKGFGCLDDTSVRRGDDLCAFTAIAYFARSYRGLPNTRYYHYNYGAGQDGARIFSPAEFDAFCDSHVAIEKVEEFLAKHEAPESYLNACQTMCIMLATNCAHKFRCNLREEDRLEAFEIMRRKWGDVTTITGLAGEYWKRPGVLASQIEDAPVFQAGKADGGVTAGGKAPADDEATADGEATIHNIGTFYYECGGGGAEGVFMHLMNLWLSMGYHVTLFMEIEPPQGVGFPDGVDVVILPRAAKCVGRDYARRAEAIREAARRYDIDVMVYHAWVNAGLFWDMLSLRTMGVRFVIHCHGVFSHYLRVLDPSFAQMPPVFALADGIVSLSETDATFWRDFNSKVYRTENPLTLDPAKTACATLKDPKVLWLARIAREKHPEDALRIFRAVHVLRPDARFALVGGATAREYGQKVLALVDEYGLHGLVDTPGWVSDTDLKLAYYQSASVFLITGDAVEGYTLSLLESKVVGLPCVMYDLPYLTLVEDHKGMVTVPFGAVEEAAEAIVKLLDDDKLRMSMGAAARKSIARVEEFDFEALWAEVFSHLGDPVIRPDVGHRQLMWSTLFAAYETGIKGLHPDPKTVAAGAGVPAGAAGNAELVQLRKANEKLKKQVEKYRTSRSWRIGRAITWLPRKVKLSIRRLRRRIHG